MRHLLPQQGVIGREAGGQARQLDHLPDRGHQVVAHLALAGKWRAKHVRDQLAPPVRKVIELAGLTPSLAAYDTLLGKEVAHGG